MTDSLFALYVSCVPGRLVTRYGTRTYIGATRDPSAEGGVRYDPETVVALTATELADYRREYDRALGAGSLRERTAEDWKRANGAPASAPPQADEPPAEGD